MLDVTQRLAETLGNLDPIRASVLEYQVLELLVNAEARVTSNKVLPSGHPGTLTEQVVL